MSTCYCLGKKIHITELLDGRLEEFGIREHYDEGTSDTQKYLTDGDSYLSIYIENGFFSYVHNPWYGRWRIFTAIAAAFDAEIFSEYQHQYWGFATAAAWRAWHAKEVKEGEDKFYEGILAHVLGESADISPDTFSYKVAKIAKELVAADPSLATPEKREEFMKAVDRRYISMAECQTVQTVDDGGLNGVVSDEEFFASLK
jgi:hypothetical protein